MLLLFCWPLTSSSYELYSHNALPHGRDLVRCFATLGSFARGIDRKKKRATRVTASYTCDGGGGGGGGGGDRRMSRSKGRCVARSEARLDRVLDRPGRLRGRLTGFWTG